MIKIKYRYKKWNFFNNSEFKQKEKIVKDLEELRITIQEIYERNSYSYIEIIKEIKENEK